jgi:hypothetical protein
MASIRTYSVGIHSCILFITVNNPLTPHESSSLRTKHDYGQMRGTLELKSLHEMM